MVAADDALSLATFEKEIFDKRSNRYKISSINNSRAGVFVGTGLGCISSAFQNYVPHLISGIREELKSAADGGRSNYAELLRNLESQPRVNPLASCKSMANAISANLSIRYGFQGPTETCISACAAGTDAISRAYRSIRYDELDLAIAGGSEFYGDRAGGVFMAFDRLNTLVLPDLGAARANRPFDKLRSGFLFSQGGACMLVLESEKHASKRNVKPIAQIVGTANTSDAHSLVAISPSENAIDLMINQALGDAGISAEQIEYVNSHGSSTRQNDLIEAKILENLFGSTVPINATKSLLGHTIGASGAIETAITAMSIANQVIHPSINIDDPVSDLNFVREKTTHSIEYAFTHSFGFGGHNVGLVLAAFN